MNIWRRDPKSNYSIVLGHRGAMGTAPENTFAGFKEALKYNTGMIEVDVHLSKDKKLIVIHKEEVSNTTDGEGMVGELDSKYIKSLDAGIKFSKGFKNERVPFLEEVFDFVKDKDVKLNVEIKNGPIVYEGIEEKVSYLIDEYGYYDKVIVSSFDHYVLKRMKEANERIHTGLLYGCSIIDIQEYALKLGVAAVNPHYFWASVGLIEKMHEADIAVITWVINEHSEFEEYSKRGADFIGTDYPDRMDGFKNN
ncbi:MAG: glycerophosphodiester phosphodiesterase [Spirochaetes bacterium]|nr:glycerophosphodiester phosphodiesterase [Spirochaetota bacterium]